MNRLFGISLAVILIGSAIGLFFVPPPERDIANLRVLFNLAGAHFKAGNLDRAKLYWAVIGNYPGIYKMMNKEKFSLPGHLDYYKVFIKSSANNLKIANSLQKYMKLLNSELRERDGRLSKLRPDLRGS